MHFQSGLLKVDASGEFSLEDAKQAFREMLGAVAQYKAKKILFDGRNVKAKPQELERFCYGEFAAQELWSRNTELLRSLRMLCISLFVIRKDLGKPLR